MYMQILEALFKAILQPTDEKYAGDTKLNSDHLCSLSLSNICHLISDKSEKTLVSIKCLYSRKRRYLSRQKNLITMQKKWKT